MKEGPRVEAIDRALMLLTALAEAGPQGCPLTDLATAIGANKSTAYRALSTMRAHGFVLQSDPSWSYRLGPAAMSLGGAFLSEERLAQALHPALVTLSREANELVHLGVLVGDQVLYIEKVEPERAIRVWSEVGRRTPVATSAMGRALLAARGVPDDQLAAYLNPVDLPLSTLSEAVHAARERGYSTEIEENEPGVACLGVAIVQDARVVAALSITTQSERMTTQRQSELSDLIRRVLPPLLPEELSLSCSPVAARAAQPEHGSAFAEH